MVCEEPPAPNCGFDDSDGDSFHSAVETFDGIDHVNDSDMAQVVSARLNTQRVKRRRIVGKTPAGSTNYTNNALATRADYRIRKERIAVQRKAEKADKKISYRKAIELLAAQPERSHQPRVEPPTEGAVRKTPMPVPHLSHDITDLANSATIIFCRRCCAWSQRTKLRALRGECGGLVTDGNKNNLRLLECGVAPYKGAKIPLHLKLCRGRKAKKAG